MIIRREDLDLFLTAGVHYGHKSWKRNPKMNPYIHGTLNKIDIIDLRKTLLMFNNALSKFKEVLSKGEKVIFICTKDLHSELIAEICNKYKQYYVNHKWYGGLLTNWETSILSVQRMQQIREILDNTNKYNYTKKELIKLQKDLDKIELRLSGCENISKIDDIKMAIVFDTIHNANAVMELKTLSIPIIGFVDTNSNPDLIDFPIPGNDDSSKAIELYIQLFVRLLDSIDIGNDEKNTVDAIDNQLRKELGVVNNNE